MTKKKLTPKQDKFTKEYPVDLNGTQAAIRSGYSKKTARQAAANLLSKSYIQAAIQIIIDRRAKKTEITAEYVLNNIKEIGERCMQKVEVKDHKGKGTGKYVFKESGALKANELLGRHLKMFTDKIEVEAGNNTLAAIFGRTPDSER